MGKQFDNYEKRIMEKLDREAEEIERRIEADPQAAKAMAGEGLDRKVYAGVEAYERAAAENENSGMDDMNPIENADTAEFTGLSEEDLEALRLGRELQKRRREEESRKASRKYAGRWKRIVAAVAVLALVAGVGVNGIGGPNRVVEIVKGSFGGRNLSRINSSTEDAKITEESEEEKAYQQIKDELGIDSVRPVDFPKGTKFKSCDIDSDIRIAQIIYDYDGKNISYYIDASYTKEAWGFDIEDEKTDEYFYKEGRLNAKIMEYRLPEGKEKKYIAEFEYLGVYYKLVGTVEWKSFEKILKNLHFPV